MILSNTTIQQALDDGRLVIDPEPGPRIATREQPTPYDRSAVDLRLSDHLRVPKQGLGAGVNPGAGSVQDTLATLYEPENIPATGFNLHPRRLGACCRGTARPPATGFNLHPRRLVLGLTVQYVKLPLPHENRRPRLSGRARRGQEFAGALRPAGALHGPDDPRGLRRPHYAGDDEPRPVAHHPDAGMAVCQLILEQVHGIPDAPASRFAGQTDPTGTT